MRDLVYYIATSIDGYIADPDGDFSGFPNLPESVMALFSRYPETCPVHLRQYFDLPDSPTRFDTVIMGANTHQPAMDAGLTSAYPHLQQYVVTNRNDFPADSQVEFVRGDVLTCVRELKAEDGMDIWLCGGSNLAQQLAPEINELQVKINPITFGNGKPLFGGGFNLSSWRKVSVEELPGDVVLITYRRAD